MTQNDASFDKLLTRAWRALDEVQELADLQGRQRARRRLMFACRIVNEVQADVQLTASTLAQMEGASRSQRRLRAQMESAGRQIVD
jgi:hypothetical protein